MIAPQFIMLGLAILIGFGLYYGRRKVKLMAATFEADHDGAHGKIGFGVKTHSLPIYYGSYTALWCAVPACLLAFFWLIFDQSVLEYLLVQQFPPAIQSLPAGELSLYISNVHNHISGIVISDDPIIIKSAQYYQSLASKTFNLGLMITFIVAIAGLIYALRKIHPHFQARQSVERIIVALMMLSSLVAVLTTLGIILSLLYESARFFASISLFDFLFGTLWSPQMALRADQVAADGSFGAIPIFAGTFLITLIAIAVAAPIGLYTAIYMSQYAKPKFRNLVKPALEVLAGVPTVVYGFFAALTVAPFLRDTGGVLGLDVSSESALAAGFVMGIMIIPFVSSLSDDVLSAVPRSLKEASLGLGATPSETIKQVLVPAALPGIVGALLLAISRAIGETMIVVMAAGLAANLTANPLQAVTTVTVQIVTLLIGDQEFDSPKTLAAFALGLVLFLITLTLNVIALRIVRKYREQYD